MPYSFARIYPVDATCESNAIFHFAGSASGDLRDGYMDFRTLAAFFSLSLWLSAVYTAYIYVSDNWMEVYKYKRSVMVFNTMEYTYSADARYAIRRAL